MNYYDHVTYTREFEYAAIGLEERQMEKGPNH